MEYLISAVLAGLAIWYIVLSVKSCRQLSIEKGVAPLFADWCGAQYLGSLVSAPPPMVNVRVYPKFLVFRFPARPRKVVPIEEISGIVVTRFTCKLRLTPRANGEARWAILVYSRRAPEFAQAVEAMLRAATSAPRSEERTIREG